MSNDNKASVAEKAHGSNIFESAGQTCELLGAIAAALLMGGCFLVGFVEIGQGLVSAAQTWWGGEHGESAGLTLINGTLSGLEVFFLAPLPFFAFISTSRLFRAIVSRSEDKLRASQQFMATVKQLIIGLMIAVISTEVIHRITGGKGLTSIEGVVAVALVAVLTMYSWLMAAKTPH